MGLELLHLVDWNAREKVLQQDAMLSSIGQYSFLHLIKTTKDLRHIHNEFKEPISLL